MKKFKSQTRREESLKKDSKLSKFNFPNDGISVMARDLADATKKRNKMIGAPIMKKDCGDCET